MFSGKGSGVAPNQSSFSNKTKLWVEQSKKKLSTDLRAQPHHSISTRTKLWTEGDVHVMMEKLRCLRRCGYCSACLRCKESHCGCMRGDPTCRHRAFNPSHPECPCDDGEITFCSLQCGYCGACMSCDEENCNCVRGDPTCHHRAFNPSHPECPCDDGEITCCSQTRDNCGGCMECADTDCNCIRGDDACEVCHTKDDH